MWKAVAIIFILVAVFFSCQQNEQEQARLDAIKIDSLHRATVRRDSILLDSIKKETYNRSGRRDERLENENRKHLDRTFR